MSYFRRKSIFIAASFALGLAFYFLVFGQASAISISPLIFELNANPGEVLQNTVRIYNDQDYSVGVRVEVQNFLATGESGQVLVEESVPGETANFSLADWVTVSPSEFELSPLESKIVTFTIIVPEGAEPGGHYASVLVGISGADVSSGGVGIAQKLGSLLLLNVSGDIKEELQIEEFSAPGYSEYGPVPITLRLRNTGSVHLKPRGFISIQNMFGKEVAKLDVPQSNVLPDSIRRISLSWGEKIQFGRYDAVLSAVYGSANEPLGGVLRFWIVPWKILAIVLIGILIVVLFLFSIRDRLGAAIRAFKKAK